MDPSTATVAWDGTPNWAGCPLGDRRRFLKKLVVAHPAFTRAVNDIEDLTLLCEEDKEGAGLLLLAPTGTGKTTLTEYFCTRWPDKIEEAITYKPVVVFNVPPSPSPKQMAQHLLKDIGDPLWAQAGSALGLTERALSLLEACKTRLVMVDNVHDIPARRREHGIEAVGDWLRNFIDRAKPLVVLLGIEQAYEVTRLNSQLRGRTATILRFDNFSIRDKTCAGRFARFLQELDKKLPLAQRSGLAAPDRVRRFYNATGGNLRLIKKLIKEALIVAVKANREALTDKDLEAGCAKLYRDAISMHNPFDLTSEPRLLDQAGEPFEKLSESGKGKKKS